MGGPQLQADRVKEACDKKLGIDWRSKKHWNGWFWYNGIKCCRVTIPHSRKSLPPKTLNSIAKQLKIEKSELVDLVQCSLDQEGFIHILRQRGHIIGDYENKR